MLALIGRKDIIPTRGGEEGRSYEIGEPDDDGAEGRTEGEREWIGGLFHQGWIVSSSVHDAMRLPTGT